VEKSLFAYEIGHPDGDLQMRHGDARGVPLGLVIDPSFDWGDDARPNTPFYRYQDPIISQDYRRFFEVNDLAAVRMDRDSVFDHAHALLFRLMEEGRLDGLRLDHTDGLHDPAQYFAKLQARAHDALARAAANSAPEGSPPREAGLLAGDDG
jgi:hypothetical protein